MPILDGDGYPIQIGPEIYLTPNPVAAGNLVTGTVADTTLTIQNIGDEDVIISSLTSSDAQVTFPGLVLPLTIAPTVQYALTVEINPSVLGAQDIFLTILSNAVNNPLNPHVTWTGVDNTTLCVSVNPTGHNFPDTKVGVSSAESLFTITNTGAVNVNVTAINFPTDFAAGATAPVLPQTLTPGQTLVFGIKFLPTQAGYIPEDVSVVSTALASPFVVKCTGTSFLITAAYSLTDSVGALLAVLVSPTSVTTVKQFDPDNWNCEEEARVKKLQNFDMIGVDKTAKWFWMHYEDLGVCTVRIELMNQVTGATQSFTRTIGRIAANEAILLDMFEVTMEAENLSIAFFKEGGDGALVVIDYGVKFLPAEEQLGTFANPLVITPAYIYNGTELLLFGFENILKQAANPLNFDCEDTAYVTNVVMLPFQTEAGAVDGFTFEKQTCRVFFHYIDHGAAIVNVQLTTMRGNTSNQNVSIGGANDEKVQNAIADVIVVDEVMEVRITKVSGWVEIVDWTAKYEMKGERSK